MKFCWVQLGPASDKLALALLCLPRPIIFFLSGYLILAGPKGFGIFLKRNNPTLKIVIKFGRQV